MSVESRPGKVGDGFVHVFAVHEDGVDGGDTTAACRAGSFHEVGKQAENRWRIAFGRRRFARRKTEFTLRHGDAGKAVEEQQNVLALVAETLRNCRRGGCSLKAHRRRGVASRCHHDALSQRLQSQVVLDEVAHFATAFADQCDDRDVGCRSACEHAEEGAFSDT